MLFTSMPFILFLSVVTVLFYLLNTKGQRVFLLLANYVFYMWWAPKFGLLLLFGTVMTYLLARAMQRRLFGRHKYWLVLGLVIMLGQLALFKYADFFLSGLAALLRWNEAPSLGLMLPVGISFYSFSAAGYLFDVYRGKTEAEGNFLTCALALSFFPSILSGPIPRVRELAPQFRFRHTPDWTAMRRGLLRFIWGAAKKLVAADSLLVIINTAYEAPAKYTGGLLLFAAIAYSLYIYLDFSAYTDMAIGVAWILGFELPENFNAPYCARTVADFWRRWHMSLTGWFREHLFFPLGGSRVAQWRVYLNILIVFAVSGLWHGAAMTFVVWGVLNGAFQIAGSITARPRDAIRRTLRIGDNNPLRVAFQIFFVFALMTAAWIFFRADSSGQAMFIIKRILLILRDGFGTMPLTALGVSLRQLYALPVFLAPFVAEEVRKGLGCKPLGLEERPWLYCLSAALLVLVIAIFGAYGAEFDQNEFVYFKF